MNICHFSLISIYQGELHLESGYQIKRNEVFMNDASQKLQSLIQWLGDPEPKQCYLNDTTGEPDPAYTSKSGINQPVKVIVTIDHIYDFATVYPSGSGKGSASCLDTMLECFSLLQEPSIFCLIVGKASDATELVKLKTSYPHNPTIILQPPFTEFIFDKHPTFPLNPTLELNQVASLETMVKFGRMG